VSQALETVVPRVRVGVCDYGVGNLRSVQRAVERSGAEAVVSDQPESLAACDGLVLPGVGAFTTAADALRNRGLDETVRTMVARGRPLLGVCLGFQLLFTDSDEGAGGPGLDLVAGHVRRIDGSRGKVPHMGWNQLRRVRHSRLLDGLHDSDWVYFVHSYEVVVDAAAGVIAESDHGGPLVAAVQVGPVMGTQFHPEKSGAAGLRIYANFTAACAAVTAH
jgi:glutamine amidotransferase